MVGEDNNQVAARIAKGLRDAGTPCEIFNPISTDAAVLRRDRIVILLALSFLIVLAWSYLLWLASDMDMDGIDMTGFRMIPSGMGLMMPAESPWRPMEFAFVFAMWTMMMVGMMIPSTVPMVLIVRPCRPTNRGTHAARCNCLVRCGLFPCVGRFLAIRHLGAMGT